MDIQEETPNWQKNLQSQLYSRDKSVNEFGDMIQQLNFYKELFNQSQKRVSELENSLRIIKSKKCDDVIKELCENQLKVSKCMVAEMELKDKVGQLEKELKVRQDKMEKKENEIHDLKLRQKRILVELRRTRQEVQDGFDERIVLQLENHCMNTKLNGENFTFQYDVI